MGEASANEDCIAKGCGRLQRQGSGAKLVRRLGAGALRYRAGQVRILESTDLNRPPSAGRRRGLRG